MADRRVDQASWAAVRSKDTWSSARFWRLARRIGKKKALIAVARPRIVAFIKDYNRKAQPFRWIYDGRPLKVGVTHNDLRARPLVT